MKALGKILGLVVLGLLLIIVGLGFALTQLLDPNDYKDEIRQLAHDKAGVELNIGGDIGWSLFPWLGLELHDTTVASAKTPDQPLANLRMLGLSVRVLPLLRSEVQMSDIQISGLELTLTRDKNGHGNWEGLGEAPASTAQAPAATPAKGDSETPTDASASPLSLDIDSLTVRDARITYQDAVTGQNFSAEGIELTSGAIREGAPIPVEFTAFLGINQPVVRARTTLEGTLRLDSKLKRYQFEGMKLAGEVSGEPLSGKTLNFSAQGELLVDLAGQTAEWNSLKLSANQLRAIGQLSARDLQKEPKIAGGLSVAEFNLGEFLEGLGQQLPTMADANALDRIALNARLAGTANSLAFEDLKLNVDDTTLSGRIAIENFQTQALRVSLKGDRMDLDRYLPPPAADEAARESQVKKSEAGAGTTPLPDKPTEHAWSDEKVLPIEQLRTLDTQLALSFNQLTLNKLPLDDFDLKARSGKGLLQLEELRSRLYGGGVSASARLDVRPATPQLSIQKRIDNVPLEPLLQAQGEEVVIKGMLDLTADLTTQGNSQRAWMNALNGNMKFAIANGVLVQANLEEQICRAIATLNRKSLSGEPRSKDTPFRQLSGTLTIQNGVANNRDLAISIPGLSVKGAGDVDLRVLGMDYRIGITVDGDKSDMPDPACQVNERLVGLEWPLRCRGPLELGARACRVDEQGLGKVAAKLAGDRLSEKLDEKLGEKVAPELKDALKGLFGR